MDRTYLPILLLLGFVLVNAIGMIALSHLTIRIRPTPVKDTPYESGIPPLGGWFAKFGIFQVLASAGSWWGYSLAIIVGINSVIALFYYARVAKAMWMEPVPDGDLTPIKVPVSLGTVLVITAVATLAVGVYPGLVTRFSDSTCLSSSPVECEVEVASP